MLYAKPLRAKINDSLEISIGEQCLTVITDGNATDIRFGPDGQVLEKEAPAPEKKDAEVRTKVVKEPPIKRG